MRRAQLERCRRQQRVAAVYDAAMSDASGDKKPAPFSGEISREERGSSGGRWVTHTDADAAEMTYSRASAKLIIIDHTYVPATLRGRGVGEALAMRAVADARREGFKIIPLCPFAKSQFERHRDWGDVLSA